MCLSQIRQKEKQHHLLIQFLDFVIFSHNKSIKAFSVDLGGGIKIILKNPLDGLRIL